MPATTLVCPHCEKTVEIQVSSVTRSRSCPECGEVVMLQMAEKSTKTKRRALLVGPATGTVPDIMDESEATPAGGMAAEIEAQPLQGDAFDRMRHDPEVREVRRTLMIGTGLVVLILVVLVALHLVRSSQEDEVRQKFFTSEAVESKDAKGSVEPPSITAEDLGLPGDPNSLVFRKTGEKKLQVSAPAPAPQMAGNLARLAKGQETVQKFLEAATWKDRLAFVRDPGRVEPLMQSFYSKNSDGPTRFDSLVEASELPSGFTEHTVVFEGGGRRVATVEHLFDGPRVDWEAFVGAGEMAWSDFLSTRRATPTVFRVQASPAGHYEHQFGDPQSLKCYSLRNISEPGAKVVYGYVDRRSALAKEIDFWLDQSSDATVPMTLSLKFPPNAPADFQVWIHQFVQSGWVVR